MNSSATAAFWIEFLLKECQFPNPAALRKHLENAEFSEFCECGCNSFKVKTASGSEPIADPGKYGMVFEANFYLKEEGKTLEVALFTGESGCVEYVEVDCCANSYPVPEVIEVKGAPYHVNASGALLSNHSLQARRP